MVELSRRTVLQTGAALGGLFFLGACGSDSDSASGDGASEPESTEVPTLDELVSAAEKEGGEMLWYLPGSADAAKAMSEGFKKAYPFTNAQAQSLVFRDLPNKLITEAITQAPTADVFMLPGPFRQTMLQNNVVTPYRVPADAELPQDLVDKEGYAHPVYILLITTIYNTNTLPGGPPKPADMVDSEFAKKMAFDRVQGLGQSTLWLSSWRNEMGDSEWVKWLDGLKANEPFITSTGGDTYAAVLRGERAFGIGSSNDINSQDPGTPMAADYSYPPRPFVQNLWLTKNAEHPATGRLFINWALSGEGQEAMAGTGRSPALQSVESPVAVKSLLPAGTTLLSGEELNDFYAKTSEYLSILNAKWPG